MSVLDQVRFSSTDYSMKDFVERFGFNLPILCQTTTGYSGCDEEEHQVAADEIYWIYAIHRQLRIVAKDERDRYISIPVDNCRYNFQVITDNNKYHPVVKAEELMKRMTSSSSSIIHIMFENDQTVSYQVGADLGNTSKFGVMELEESYEEKYLVGFGIHSDSIYVKTVGIPVYLDINFAVSTGFQNQTDKGERYKKWIKDLKTLADTLETTPIHTCQEVIVFPERPSNGDYEYISLRNGPLKGGGGGFGKNINEKDSTHREFPTVDIGLQRESPGRKHNGGKVENEYSYIEGNDRSTSSTQNQTSTIQSGGDPRSYHRNGQHEVRRVSLPGIPRRPPPPLPSPATESNPTSIDRKNHQDANNDCGDIYDEIHSSREQQPPKIPSRTLSREKKKGVIYESLKGAVSAAKIQITNSDESVSSDLPASGDIQYDNVFADNLSADVHSSDWPIGSLSLPSSFLDMHSRKDSPYGSQLLRALARSPLPLPMSGRNSPASPAAATVGHSASMNNLTGIDKWSDAKATPLEQTDPHWSSLSTYATASEVPVDVDVESWTVNDVAESLRLMKMKQYSHLFKELEVDGALILNLNESSLIEDFGFKQFEATKFVMFVKKGWRPK